MEGASIENTLGRIEAALDRIERAAGRVSTADDKLAERHERLRAAVTQSLRQLDTLLGGATLVSNVSLTIGGRSFTVACAAGEEDHVADLGRMIAAKVSAMGDLSGQSESRMLLFAALLLADELHEATVRAAPAPAPAPAPALANGSAEKLEAIAERLESLAMRLEA